jgi:pyruvate carboxylase subunit B
MKYVVTVGGRDRMVAIDGDTVTVDDVPVAATLHPAGRTPLRLLTIAGHHHRVAVAGRRGDDWHLVVDGAVREVAVIDERTRQIRALVVNRGGGSLTGTVKAPMPGLVVRVHVVVGDIVESGQGLIVLEAMKMENELRAPLAGRVVSLRAAAGEAVDKGTVLVEIDGTAPGDGALS